MLDSLHACDVTAQTVVVCLDDTTFDVLGALALPGVVPVPLSTVEETSPSLRPIKAQRTIVEYYWSITPVIIEYVFEQYDCDCATYLDADLYFYTSPQCLLQEMGEASVLIHGHNFPQQYKRLEQYGLYNVGLMCFRNDAEGRKVLSWWARRCLEWCFDRLEGDRYGDQKYLDQFQKISPAVCVCQNPGVGVAPWNELRYAIGLAHGKPTVDGKPVVFYHFHSFIHVAPGCAVPAARTAYYLTLAGLSHFAAPYMVMLQHALEKIRTVMPTFTAGFRTDAIQPELCSIMTPELQEVFREAGFEHFEPLQTVPPMFVAVTQQLALGATKLSPSHALFKHLVMQTHFPRMPRLLNLGCGNHFHNSWLNLDIFSRHASVCAVDLRQPWPLPDDWFDMVYHSHVLEHMSMAEGTTFLHRCFAVLKQDGIVRIAVPDLEEIARQYLAALDEARQGAAGAENRRAWMLLELIDQTSRHHSGGAMAEYFKQSPLPEKDFVLSRIGREGEGLLDRMQGKPACHAEETDPAKVGAFRLAGEVHRWMYDAYSLRKALEDVGFVDVHLVDSTSSAWPNFAGYMLDADAQGITRKPNSFFMEARKPAQSEVKACAQTDEMGVALPALTYRTGAQSNWSGDYPDWESAERAAEGYAAKDIFARVYTAARAVRDGKALWERDSVTFQHEEYNVPLLKILCDIATSHGELHVLDFGGALGSTYVQNKARLAHLPVLSWNVVEQQHLVACGKREFADAHLGFYPDVETVLAARPVNVALLSGVVQYLSPAMLESVLDVIPQQGIHDIIFDRTPFRHDVECYRIERPSTIYPGASYSTRFFSLPAFDTAMRTRGYALAHSCSALDGARADCVFLMLHYTRKIYDEKS